MADLATKTLVRTASFDFDLKRAEADQGAMVMSGRLAVFNDWTEIKSPVERPYHFMERIAPGAFSKTIQENGHRLKVLFQHGQDAAIGQKPIGRIMRLEETNGGVEYDVELLDAPYVDDLVPGLEAGLYGSSFQAHEVKSETVQRPKRSDYNPQRLPEITRKELKMLEFGPVTFPSYGEANARMRSQTHEFMLPGLRELVALIRSADLQDPALTEDEKPEPEPETPIEGDDGAESTSDDDVSRSQAHDDQEEKPSWFLE